MQDLNEGLRNNEAAALSGAPLYQHYLFNLRRNLKIPSLSCSLLAHLLHPNRFTSSAVLHIVVLEIAPSGAHNGPTR